MGNAEYMGLYLMGKDQRLRYSKKEARENVKMVFTHGKKKTAIANAVVARGTGVITVNRIPTQNIEPKNLRIKVRVTGGGPTAQLYAARMAIAKGIVSWKQKYVDEEEKTIARKTLVSYDKGLLVADPRRCEPKKYGGPGARARAQKSYR